MPVSYFGENERVPSEHAIHCGGGRTLQAHKDSCDINLIIKRIRLTGLTGLEHVNHIPPSYGDFTDVKSYLDSLSVVRSAEEAFARIPVGIRAKCGFSPTEFIRYIENPANKDELIAAGILTERPAVVTSPVPDNPVIKENDDGATEA